MKNRNEDKAQYNCKQLFSQLFLDFLNKKNADKTFFS